MTNAMAAFTVVDENGTAHTYLIDDDVPEEHVKLVQGDARKVIFGEAADEDEEESFVQENGGEDEYERMTVPQLVEMANNRNLNVTSTRKADLIDLLKSSDAAG